jgi:hypothetical protein
MTSKSTLSVTKSNNKNKKYVEQKLKNIPFDKLSIESGFKKREEKKISGKGLLIAFILMAMQGKNSYEQWAQQLGKVNKENISKQGLCKRITGCFTAFILKVLFASFALQMYGVHTLAKNNKLLKQYKRALLQDSTTVNLPVCLSWCFPGNVSNGQKKSQLKIQVIYDVLNNQFVHFEITPYTANDQSKSKGILSIANEGDLVIRDLGYFVLECFQETNKRDISFVSRLRYGVNIYDEKTDKEIDLLKRLKKYGCFDKWVLIGSKQKVKVRLVAVKLSEKQANERRRKAKNDRDRRLNHDEEYYQMLGYSLFILNEDTFTPDQIAQIYSLRWRIEIIFKCWKSHFNLQKIISQNNKLTKERVEAIMYMMLIFILIFQSGIYNYIMDYIKNKKSDILISLLKLSKFIALNINLFFEQDIETLCPQILYYCKYEKRKKRKNFLQNINLS